LSNKAIYVLGTGLSHDGSSCLLKDGAVVCAIEKERLTRKKHDGGNDALTVQYCLDYAGIGAEELALVVQAANFEKDTISKSRYKGKRYFDNDLKVPFVSISHHLAHAYSAIGTCPFGEGNVLVIDGCGSPYEQCDDQGAYVPQVAASGLYAEKDSYYHFSAGGVRPLYKDFSEIQLSDVATDLRLPTTRHSIGGLYSMVSQYVFGNMDDAGKLMGLAPYGNRNVYKENIFSLTGGRVLVREEALRMLSQPATSYEDLKKRFQYFADVAAWAQREVEEAIIYTVKQRLQYHYSPNLCYAGGVALNAVANARIMKETGVKDLYMAPAAADNGLSVGCAFYGWLEILKKQRRLHNGSTYFGKVYADNKIEEDIKRFKADNEKKSIVSMRSDDTCAYTAALINAGKVVGWFQGASEFGPRALGNRSILADARLQQVRLFINREIKFREDFRPFAPAVMAEDVTEYFEHGYESPYMILVDQVKPQYKKLYGEVMHVDGSARVQTVSRQLNEKFYTLLQKFKEQSGSGILLNTSLNRRGMPIVETAYEALSLFYETKLDALVIHDWIFEKEAGVGN
jgi:carbamoyltransferase